MHAERKVILSVIKSMDPVPPHSRERTAAIFWAWTSIVLAVAAWIALFCGRDPRAIGLGATLGVIILGVVRSTDQLPLGLRRLSLGVYVISAAVLLFLAATQPAYQTASRRPMPPATKRTDKP